jgi:sortase A
MDRRPIHVQAPSVGLDASVVEVFLRDGAWEVADYAAGYLHGTGTPGDGNVVLAGHKGIRGAVFAGIEALTVGDEIAVDTADRRFRYRVREAGVVWPSQVNVMFPTTTPTLTLLTCTNWDMQRFVVIADLVESAPLAASTGG